MPAPEPSAGLSQRDKRREVEMERREVRGARATGEKLPEPLGRAVGLTSQGRAMRRQRSQGHGRR